MRSKPYVDRNPDEPTEEPPKEHTTATALEASYGVEVVEPAPGDTTRQKQPLPPPKKPKSRPRKLLTQDELTTEEEKLRKRYPHIVKGTLRNATKGNPMDGLTQDEIRKFKHKRSVIIQCQRTLVGQGEAPCTANRRIATSDLAQVLMCENCTREERNARKRERRAIEKAKREN